MIPIEEISQSALLESENANLHELLLFNDEVNTFDHVIEMLVTICNHSYLQAEQCAFIVHHKGKCTVKTGSYDELKPKCLKLLEAGLSAEIS
jgi:ATP-dependent Clp protease adaptor protein ClpS